MISVKEAQDLILSKCSNFSIESKNINEISNSVLAEEILSDRDYPPFNRSAMDGYAIYSNYYRPEKSYLIEDTIFAGENKSWSKNPDSCIKIMTGAPVPEGMDCVIKKEDSIEISQGLVQFKLKEASQFLNVARKAEDLKENELALKPGIVCSPQTVSLLATLGIENAKVYKKPIISIFSTGNEIVPINAPVAVEQIRDSNSYALISFIGKYGIKPEVSAIAPDDKEKLKSIIRSLLYSNCLIFSGGVSAGEKDFIPEALKELGIINLFHKVNIKPGKPLWFGVSKDGNAIFGLPGNPFSVQVIYKLFVENWIRKFLNMNQVIPIYLPLLKSRIKKHKLEEYFPVKLKNQNNKTFLEEIRYNGSGDIKAGLHSDGIAMHKSDQYELFESELIPYYSWI